MGRAGAVVPVTAAGGGRPCHLMVFTRDLRVADHPALAAAVREADVVCAFVFDDAIRRIGPENPLRTGFLLQSLAELDDSLRRLGSRLVVRRGNWVAEVLALATEIGAEVIHLSEDVTPFARARAARLGRMAARSFEIRQHQGIALVEPGTILPAGGDHYRVFTPYHRRWLSAPTRELLPAPQSLQVPAPNGSGVGPRSLPLHPPRRASVVGPGGERAAHRRLDAWAHTGLRAESSRRAGRGATLSDPGGSELSAYLHFGCISPLQVAGAVAGLPGSDPFLRRICWRDFYLQILAARPEAAWDDYVDRAMPVRDDPELLDAWRQGRTGFPIVDASMRQLHSEGFLFNRARMIVASFLTKHLQLDWRQGARHFLDRLVDADVAANNLNWQWTAGRGTGSNPYRFLDPARQARLFDRDGTYVRRWLPELEALRAPQVHNPDPDVRARMSYPDPVLLPPDAGRRLLR